MTAPEPARCRVGCAQRVITPPLGVCLAGYFHERRARSVRDDLHARAIVIDSADEWLALVSCDLITPDEAVTSSARAMIAEETRIPPERVMICTTHTHTGPESRAGHAVERDDTWAARLPRHIADAVREAATHQVTATARPGRTDVHGYAFNRLFRQKDGREVFGRRPGEEIAPAGPIDPQLQTLSFVDEQENLRALLVHYALHVDVIGGGSADFISADWPGELARNIAAVYGPHVVTLFCQGTCGDINHGAHAPTALPQGGPGKAAQLGRALAGAAMLATERAEPMGALPIADAGTTLTVPYYTRDHGFLARLAELKAGTDLSAADQYVLRLGEAWPHDGRSAQLPLQALRLGDVGLVALPAEIFVGIGLDIKRYAPAPFTFVIELANADVSTYIPTADQAGRGAYGAVPVLSRWLCADAGPRVADAALKLLWELW